MNKLFIDTNIFIYSLDNSSKFYHLSEKILNLDIPLLTSSKNISEYFAVTTKLGIDSKIVWEFYEDIKSNLKILFPNRKSLKIFETLLKKYKPVGNRIFDMEVISVMLANNIRYISTVNTKDFETIEEISIYSKSGVIIL
jgi:predicted nucleic acid-binding protein